MTEILTESFCERCGTRYTFESAAPRKSRLGRVRTVSRGLKNYVLQDESSFSEAMADARSEDERSATAHQLDAFHKTFNFCMTCRQYTCGNCWNAEDGRCLTCSPLPGSEIEAPAAASAEPAIAPVPLDAAWPDADLGADRLARALGIAAAESAEPGPGAAAGTSAAPDTARDVPAVAAEDAGLPAGAQLRGLAPGQTLEDAVAAYEAQVAEQESAGREVEVPAAAEPLVDVGAEPEPVVAAAEPEPVVAAAEPEPAAAPEPPLAAVPPAAARDDVVDQPTWPVAASAASQAALPAAPASPAPTAPPAPAIPEAPLAPANPWLTVAPDDGSAAPEPQWPIASQWGRNTRTDVPTTLAGRQLIPRDDAAALWAASAAEVLSGLSTSPQPLSAPAPIAPQPCSNCGLSLSANARFCRRCGTRQG